MRKAHLYAAVAALSLASSAQAGEILITGWFEPGYATGYVNSNYDYTYGDTSGDKFGALINFNVAANFASPKVLTFDTPVYGEVTESFTSFDYIRQTAIGLFYELTGPTGWLDVNIPYADAPPSFSFVDYGVTAPPPPSMCGPNSGPHQCSPIDPPPSIDPPGGGITPPPSITGGAPEASTWAMMALGFAALGLAGYRRQRTARLAVLV